MPNMKIQFIDTTLREGFQSAVPLFKDGISPTAYAQAIVGRLHTAFAEIYGPDLYYSAEEYSSIVQTLNHRLQLYCGIIDQFNADTKQHINALDAPRLSFTVIHKNDHSIDKIRQILALYPSATMRLGVECAGSAEQWDLGKLLQQLDQLDRVENITLSDSNGSMTPTALRKLIKGLPQLTKTTVGFHLHNDRGMAVANAITAIETATDVGLNSISLDYTFYGLGERYGLLSLQEIAASGEDIVNGKKREEIRIISELFSDEASRFHELPYMKDVVHVAASHFDSNGKLRPEYQTDN